MNRFWPILKWILILWGFISFIGAVAIGAYFYYKIGPGNTDAINSADKQDVRFILNWCRLGDERIEKVIHIYQSARSLTGDHLDAYSIKITNIDQAELIPDQYGAGWYRCDQVNGVLKDALEFAVGWLHDENISWFPRVKELTSSEMYVWPWSIYCQGVRPSSVKLIFVRPRDKMVFFMSAKV